MKRTLAVYVAVGSLWMVSSAAAADHFRCFKTIPTSDSTKLPQPTLNLSDEFETRNFRVSRSANICNAASINDSPIIDPTAHIQCLIVTPTQGNDFAERVVTVHTLFGTFPALVDKAQLLCAPTAVDGLEATKTIDNFKCYTAHQHTISEPEVQVQETFEDAPTRPDLLAMFCNRVSVDGGGIDGNPKSHLACFETQESPSAPAFTPIVIDTENAVGSEELNVVKRRFLCVKAQIE